jgi:hypothetical protein
MLERILPRQRGGGSAPIRSSIEAGVVRPDDSRETPMSLDVGAQPSHRKGSEEKCTFTSRAK